MIPQYHRYLKPDDRCVGDITLSSVCIQSIIVLSRAENDPSYTRKEKDFKVKMSNKARVSGGEKREGRGEGGGGGGGELGSLLWLSQWVTEYWLKERAWSKVLQ